MADEITNQVYALIPAAGRGVRFSRIGANGERENKVFAPLLGRPLLGWTLQAFADCDAVDRIILIGSEADLPRLREIGEMYGGGKLASVVLGGETRQESVRLGLEAIPEAAGYVIVHDAARCCVQQTDLLMVRHWLRKFYAYSYALPVSDTLVRGTDRVALCADMGEPVPRDGLWAMQTPQFFLRDVLERAHAKAVEEGFVGTDDAGLVRRLGESDRDVTLVVGSPENIKVTLPEDLTLARAILLRRLAASPSLGPYPSSLPSAPSTAPASRAGAVEGADGNDDGYGPEASTYPIRVGHGYDVHPFAEGRPLWLGGVHFPESPVGLIGHSDADALLHAVCDALLGAAGIGGDIGALFPPSDARHKDRPSIEFLAEVMSRIRDAGWRVGNVDVSVLAEFPKIGPRAGDIRRVIAVCLRISADAVSVKATTNEKMGFVGRGEGIAVHATVLIHR